jgi:C-terminal processing protease CtpA/Prc
MNRIKKIIYLPVVLGLILGGFWAGNYYRNHYISPVLSLDLQREPFGGALALKTDEVPEMSAREYFRQLSLLLKEKYVDSIQIDDKYALSAIRSMIGYLADPNSQFFDKEQFANLLRIQEGMYEGIGVELTFLFSEEQLKNQEKEDNVDLTAYIPELLVSAVLPNSPAAKAGLQPGDVIKSVNDKWMLSSKELAELKTLHQKLLEKKITQKEYDAFKKDLNAKFKKSITAQKARDLLISGAHSILKVGWKRDSKFFSANITKQQTKVPSVEKNGEGVLTLRFFNNAPQELKTYLEGAGALTIDLRNSGRGNFQSMRECLELLLPKGTYGLLVQQNQQKPFTIEKGNPQPPQINLLVDSSTTGAARIFAKVLATSGYATLQGSLPDSELPVVEVFPVKTSNAGTQGYTLTTHLFKPKSKEEASAQ